MNRMRTYSATGLFMALTACGSGDHSAEEHECGDHGELHAGHCDCDDGYEPDPVNELSCISSEEDGDPVLPTPQGRLLVSDGAEGQVVVVDLKSGSAVATLTTNGASRSYASSSGDWGFAVQSGADAVQRIDPGLRYVDHGDHVDVTTSEPEVVSMPVVSCVTPIHFVAHDDHAATFCDGDGMLHVFDDTVANAEYEITEYDSGRPHHGVGLVGLGSVILSMPNPEDEEDVLPVGVRVLGFDGVEQFAFDGCSLLHGEASTDEQICFGCSDGVMCLSENSNGEIESNKVVSEEPPDEGVRVGSMVAQDDVVIGNWGNDLVHVQYQTGTLMPIPFGELYLQFLITEDSQHLIVLADSGVLYKLGLDGEVVASLSLMPEFIREPGHGQLRPKFVINSGFAYVIDPRHPEVFEVDLAIFEMSPRKIELPAGKFHNLALVALPPQ